MRSLASQKISEPSECCGPTFISSDTFLTIQDSISGHEFQPLIEGRDGFFCSDHKALVYSCICLSDPSSLRQQQHLSMTAGFNFTKVLITLLPILCPGHLLMLSL